MSRIEAAAPRAAMAQPAKKSTTWASLEGRNDAPEELGLALIRSAAIRETESRRHGHANGQDG